MTTSQQPPTGRHQNLASQIPQQWGPPPTDWGPQASTSPAPKKRRKWPFIVGGLILLLIIIGVASGTNSAPAPVAAPLPTYVPAPLPTVTAPTYQAPAIVPAPTIEAPAAAPSVETAPALPVSRQNAVDKAESYLEFTSFSRTGLIKQLKFEDFSTADATYAVDHVTVDWMEQAAKKAKDYMGFTSFSRGSLINQLKFDGFTAAQAKHGVESVGL